MTFDPYAKTFYIKTSWKPRKEDPDAIAERLRRLLDELATLDETLKPWILGIDSCMPYSLAERDLATIICRDVVYGEDGKIDLKAGYDVSGWTDGNRQDYSLLGPVGGVYPYPMNNGVTFETRAGRPVNENIVTYALMKQATLAMIAAWEPMTCFARSSDLTPDFANEGHFAKAWMTYVRAADVATVDLVGVPFSERTPDGGLLLSATDQTFDAHNPDHIKAAHVISQATQHLNGILEAS